MEKLPALIALTLAGFGLSGCFPSILTSRPEAEIFVTVMMDESIRAAMEASAREQGIKLRSWSEYRFQYQARGNGLRDTRVFVHAICRAPADFDLTQAFYSVPDENACFFDTTYVDQSYTDQSKSGFTPLQIVAGKS